MMQERSSSGMNYPVEGQIMIHSSMLGRGNSHIHDASTGCTSLTPSFETQYSEGRSSAKADVEFEDVMSQNTCIYT